jgi:hypothetical protein
MAGRDPAIHESCTQMPGSVPGMTNKEQNGDRSYRFSNTSLAMAAAVIAAGQPA